MTVQSHRNPTEPISSAPFLACGRTRLAPSCSGHDFALDLLEHEIQHHGQLIRFGYSNSLAFPPSWNSRHTVSAFDQQINFRPIETRWRCAPFVRTTSRCRRRQPAPLLGP
jgi:hypothetical protein